MDVQQIQQVLKEFSKESAKAEMQQDMVNDAMEMGMDNVEDEADDVYDGILGEIGLEYQMNDGNRVNKEIVVQQQNEEVKHEVDDMEARLAALKQVW